MIFCVNYHNYLAAVGWAWKQNIENNREGLESGEREDTINSLITQVIGESRQELRTLNTSSVQMKSGQNYFLIEFSLSLRPKVLVDKLKRFLFTILFPPLME